MIMKMSAPDIGFGFGWEPDSKALFIIHTNGAPHEQIASNIETPEIAHLMAAMWCRGYRSRVREMERVPGNKHYHMLAETGKVEMKLGRELPVVS